MEVWKQRQLNIRPAEMVMTSAGGLPCYSWESKQAKYLYKSPNSSHTKRLNLQEARSSSLRTKIMRKCSRFCDLFACLCRNWRMNLVCAGNFFFAGARLFLCSMEAAIFLFSRVARIPEGSFVLPAIRTESSITLGAELVGGSIIRGQNQISHPIHDCNLLSSHPWSSLWHPF